MSKSEDLRMSSNTAAVLTGDIVASRRATKSDLDDGLSALRDAAQAFGPRHGFSLRFTRYRGDGWQVYLADPALALRTMVFLRARLKASVKGLDTRVAAGLGEADIGHDSDLSAATGDAFFRSGEALDAIGDHRMAMAGHPVPDWPETVVSLLDAILSDWTAAQAEAAAIDVGESIIQADIAAKLGITRQAVQQRLAGAKISAVTHAIETFERTLGPAT